MTANRKPPNLEPDGRRQTKWLMYPMTLGQKQFHEARFLSPSICHSHNGRLQAADTTCTQYLPTTRFLNQERGCEPAFNLDVDMEHIRLWRWSHSRAGPGRRSPATQETARLSSGWVHLPFSHPYAVDGGRRGQGRG